jgi:hypothetical protein
VATLVAVKGLVQVAIQVDDPKNPYVWDGAGHCLAVTFCRRSVSAQSAGVGTGIESWEIDLEISTGYRHCVPVLALDGEQ